MERHYVKNHFDKQKIQKHIYIYTYTMKQVNPIKVYNKILYELMFLFF